ncbi:MAG TPA: hypothetical protein VJN71_10720 [Nitrososphaerales archaeon]|nr:hypothetical protein [Nitrososphaerales archaeon]
MNRRDYITALQFFVGGLVTLGGAAFARFGTFPIGTALGILHLGVGLIGLFGGYAYLTRKSWSRTFLVWINTLTIIYSTFAEILAEVYAFLPRGINDAFVGTIVAIVVSPMIIYLVTSDRSSRSKSVLKAQDGIERPTHS